MINLILLSEAGIRVLNARLLRLCTEGNIFDLQLNRTSSISVISVVVCNSAKILLPKLFIRSISNNQEFDMPGKLISGSWRLKLTQDASLVKLSGKSPK
jgi:hypothetical protein